MNNIKNLLLRTGIFLLIGSACGCSLQKQSTSEKNEIITTFEFDINLESTINKMNEIYTISSTHTPSSVISTPTPTLPFMPIIFDEPTSEQTTIQSNIVEEDNRMLVSLTFDDGPSAYTEDLLNLLAKYNIKATFFVVKYNCVKYPDTLTLIEEYGHEIAIHSATHTDFTTQTISEVDNEIKSTIEYIESLGINASELVRPPYGSINSRIKKNIAYPFINWDIDTEDWKTRDKDEIKKEIIDNIHEGAIILMHDHHSSEVHNANLEALEEIMPELIKEYKFVTVTELSESLNVELENGKLYRKIKSEN